MNCYEITDCSEERRNACFVFKHFHNKNSDMENISCWILKRGNPDWTPEDQAKCAECDYYKAMDQDGITVRYGEGENAIVVIECRGTLNMLRTKVLGEVADKLKEQGQNKVILDLSAVTNIYSCAMSMIVRLHLQCEKLGGLLVMAGATGYVKVAIGTVFIDRFIKTAETMDAAMAAMK
jgi:anti-anti-sigma factor